MYNYKQVVWCAYDPVEQAWWPMWIRTTRALLREDIKREIAARPGEYEPVLRRLVPQKVRLVRVF